MSKYLEDLNLKVSAPQIFSSPKQRFSQVNGVLLCIAGCGVAEKMEGKGAKKEFGRQSPGAEPQTESQWC